MGDSGENQQLWDRINEIHRLVVELQTSAPLVNKQIIENSLRLERRVGRIETAILSVLVAAGYIVFHKLGITTGLLQ